MCVVNSISTVFLVSKKIRLRVTRMTIISSSDLIHFYFPSPCEIAIIFSSPAPLFFFRDFHRKCLFRTGNKIEHYWRRGNWKFGKEAGLECQGAGMCLEWE